MLFALRSCPHVKNPLSLKKFIALLSLATVFTFSTFADSTWKATPRVHSWGAELDLGWSPVELIKGTQTRFWLGLEGLYKNWNYFHDAQGNELTSAVNSDAAAHEINGLWFLGMSQGLLAHTTPDGWGQPWKDPNLVELFGYYKGILFHPLASGAYWTNASVPDKNGYLQTSFLGGVALNLMTKTNLHNLKEGLALEASGEWAPEKLQSVGVDFQRVTAIAQGFMPLYDSDPAQRLNAFSVLGGWNIALDQLWGNTIPAQELQLIGGRLLDGVGGWVEGAGGAIRGVDIGRYDGTQKAVFNAEVRFNLPGFEITQPWNIPFIDNTLDFVPGLIAYSDAGWWNGVTGLTGGSALTAGFGIFLAVLKYGQVAVYNDHWLAGGSVYEPHSFEWHAELGMHF